jgi:hypothetical protein
LNQKGRRPRRKAVLPREHNTHFEDASTTIGGELSRFVWMSGCVLQDACDNMPLIQIFKLKLEVATQQWQRRRGFKQVN